jgi:hypothetical protein
MILYGEGWLCGSYGVLSSDDGGDWFMLMVGSVV